MSNERVVVKFTQSWRGYSKGERAGFDAEQAKALIDGKVAEVVKAVPAAAAGKGAPAGKANGGTSKPAKPAAENKPADPEPSLPAPEVVEPEAGGNTQPGDDDDEPKP